MRLQGRRPIWLAQLLRPLANSSTRQELPAGPMTAYDSSFHPIRLAETCRKSWIPRELVAADQTKRSRAADQTPCINGENTRQRNASHPVSNRY
ncbi:uncharacterized protein K444DRAFT_406775 [Hyaloscypha bicolor E]|uniref:Uncharacterized protein n=1 Tax=Hyaloscypha bicolor E TaxID=1095630 RepID=A0A2J6T9G9_9HELO|nr:uncharacterized protein K444DRAFT_406775 [Hyaloscypha bicolor E]PMD59623.1 hypothetical protein K444DRAFT_406775 [Hyaloscypha bicolor E]